ncbi:MAG: hypothetical protein ACREGD_00465 [Candidatus Saccharimonadales bacterium]
MPPRQTPDLSAALLRQTGIKEEQVSPMVEDPEYAAYHFAAALAARGTSPEGVAFETVVGVLRAVQAEITVVVDEQTTEHERIVAAGFLACLLGLASKPEQGEESNGI